MESIARPAGDALPLRGDGGTHTRAAARAGQAGIPNESAKKSRGGALDPAHPLGQPADAPGIAQARKARSKGRFLV